jgi:ParB family transcriptional regulator, chromosome partitioning protein
MEKSNRLQHIPVDEISPNPENPRIFFRSEEMDRLLISIRQIGVQVPISVYRDKGRYILIDGERRWRTSKKLNLPTIPAIVQDAPSPLQNLLLMFNIHALREQWDLFTIGNKVTVIIRLLTEELGRPPREQELSERTGLSISVVRRTKLLIDLPDKYKAMLLEELRLPKNKQKLSEDFFIEMERALKTARTRFPEMNQDLDAFRDTLISKYREGVIENILDFRKLSKLATAPANVSISSNEAFDHLMQIFSDGDTGIEEVFDRSVGNLYNEKHFLSQIESLAYQIERLGTLARDDEQIREALLRVKGLIESLLAKGRSDQ